MPAVNPTVRLELDVPTGALAALHRDRESFGRELLVAAAVKWYEARIVSQGRAAEIAGLSRAEFLTARSARRCRTRPVSPGSHPSPAQNEKPTPTSACSARLGTLAWPPAMGTRARARLKRPSAVTRQWRPKRTARPTPTSNAGPVTK